VVATAVTYSTASAPRVLSLKRSVNTPGGCEASLAIAPAWVSNQSSGRDPPTRRAHSVVVLLAREETGGGVDAARSGNAPGAGADRATELDLDTDDDGFAGDNAEPGDLGDTGVQSERSAPAPPPAVVALHESSRRIDRSTALHQGQNFCTNLDMDTCCCCCCCCLPVLLGLVLLPPLGSVVTLTSLARIVSAVWELNGRCSVPGSPQAPKCSRSTRLKSEAPTR